MLTAPSNVSYRHVPAPGFGDVEFHEAAGVEIERHRRSSITASETLFPLLLGGIPGVELLAFAESEMCSGSACIYNLVQPDAARRLGARKVGHLAAVALDIVAPANPGCTLQIASTAVGLGALSGSCIRSS